MSAHHEYVLEILTEEIPAWMLRDRLEVVRSKFAETLRSYENRDDPVAKSLVDATSRRIVVHLTDLVERQPDREQEVKGPPVKIAWNDNGEPTKALEGFLKKNGASIDEVEKRDSYAWIRQTVAGKTAAGHLAETVPPIIESLRWPKMMYWGRGRTWIRPIHSVISLFDDQPVEIEIFGIRSGSTTVGHRTRHDGLIEISGWDDYERKLIDAKVVIRADERVRIMREKSVSLAAEVGGAPADDHEIWEQWRYLTECPGLVRAEFDDEFLKLPSEVLITVMRVHQKQLPIYADGELTHSFLAVVDGDSDPLGHAATGNSFVTNARFADALFFYETDRKIALEDRLDQLSHLQFQEALGNYREKTERIEANVLKICTALKIDGNATLRAARLCKTDLVTEMVKEFTDLQGQIGGIYAREEGLDESVWSAIYDHYLPAGMSDPLPRSLEGAIVSTADRMDTLCGFFIQGLVPTGSRDPFALRRSAQGIVRILLKRDKWQLPFSIDALMDIGFSPWTVTDDTRNQLKDFLAERVRNVLEGAKGYAYDEINAAMDARWTDSLQDLEDRIIALRDVRSSAEFLSIIDSVKRIENIVPVGFNEPVDSSKLEHATEMRLAKLATVVGDQIDELVAQRKYRDALASFAAMAPELERFFNDVLVMAEDESVRNNRWALLRQVGQVVANIAVVTRIVIDRKELTSA